MLQADALFQAEALYRAGAYGEAGELLSPLAVAGGAPADVLRLLGLIRLRQGDLASALDLLARARKTARHDPWTALHFGLGLVAAGHPAEAEPFLREAAAQLPSDPAPLVNLAGALIALGRADEAVRAASDACFRAPQLPEAHYVYGQAWLAAGRLEEADVAFSDAVTLAPRFADAWVNLGLVRYRKGLLREAMIAMRRALAVDPNHRAAFANLASFQRLIGNDEQLEARLREWLEKDPGAIGVRLNLAAVLLDVDRAEEALELLDIAPPAAPVDRHSWALQRSALLLNFDRAEEAARAIEEAGPLPLELEPLKAWREVLLALGRGETEAARARAEEMEQAIENGGSAILPDHAIASHFELARFWSRRRERDRAFEHWRKGHQALAPFQPFSREAFRDFVDASIEVFGRDRLNDGPRAANADATPVYIVGMPRSGTTLAEQILDAHAEAHGAGERAALADVFARLGGDRESAAAARRVSALGAPALDAAAAAFLEELRALAPAASRIVDKMPGNLSLLGLVALLLPRAKIIHCTRDPRDVGLSIFSRRFRGYHPYAHDLSDLGWYIAEQDRLMAHWKAVLPNPILTLDHSEWIADFDATLARMLAHVGLPHDPNCEKFYESDRLVRTASRWQVRQPINAKGVGRWKAHADQLAPLIAALEEGGMDLEKLDRAQQGRPIESPGRQ